MCLLDADKQVTKLLAWQGDDWLLKACLLQTVLPLGVMRRAKQEPELRDPAYDHGDEML